MDRVKVTNKTGHGENGITGHTNLQRIIAGLQPEEPGKSLSEETLISIVSIENGYGVIVRPEAIRAFNRALELVARSQHSTS